MRKRFWHLALVLTALIQLILPGLPAAAASSTPARTWTPPTAPLPDFVPPRSLPSIPPASPAPTAPIPLTFGETVTGTITDIVPITYTFTAETGDVVTFWVGEQDSSLEPRVKLYAPSGTRIFSATGETEPAVEGLVTLQESGAFLLTVEDSGYDGGDFSLFIQRVNQPSLTSPLTSGEIATATLHLGTEMKTYTFEGRSGAFFLLRATLAEGTGGPLFRLFAPDGQPVDAGSTDGSTVESTQPLPADGRYTLLIGDQLRSLETRAIAFRVVQGEEGASPLQYGDTLTATLQGLLATDLYTFSAHIGDVVRLTVEAIDGSAVPKVWWYAGNGVPLFVGCADQQPVVTVTIPADGPSALLIGDRDGVENGTYHFAITRTGTVSAMLLLDVVGPRYVSPGDEVDYAISYVNPLSSTAEDAVIVAQLPEDAFYVSHTGSGGLWPERHQVVWKLGDVPPGARGMLSVRVKYLWGMRNNTPETIRVVAASRNAPNPYIDLEEYLRFSPVRILGSRRLSEGEITTFLAEHPRVATLIAEGEAEGLHFYNLGYETVISTGEEISHTYDFIIIDPPNHRAWIIGDHGNGAFAAKFSDHGLGLLLPNGDGFASVGWDFASGAQQGDGSSFSSCLLNCIGGQVPWWILGSLVPVVQVGLTAADCFACGQGSFQGCVHCGAGILSSLPGLGWIGIASDLADCAAKCQRPQRCNPIYACAPDFAGITTESFFYPSALYRSPLFPQSITSEGGDWVEIRECDPITGKLLPPEYRQCPPGQKCIGGLCGMPDDEDTAQVTGAHDPNAKYAPACASQGQWLTYTVEYENEGDGTAHNVFITDPLPPAFWGSTVRVAEGGLYITRTHLLYWSVGEVVSHTGGEVHFAVQVPLTMEEGSEVVNVATVHFPSVPEETQTNAVVTRIAALSACPQRV